MKPVIEIKDLNVHFTTPQGLVRAVNGVTFHIAEGKTMCLVGESGSGKSITARALLQIIPKPGKIISGDIILHHDGKSTNIATLSPKGQEIRKIRGSEIAMIFQEPMTSLSPLYTVGNQIMEAILLHTDMNKKEAREHAIQLLKRVGIPKPEQRVDEYPFKLSGGMRQRVMIAMALSCNPKVLIADEPTTALDVTTQAQILDLMRELQEEQGMAILFITHDLGVVAEIADDVAVMYLGNTAEFGTVDEVFNNPKHPYTKALLSSIPKIGAERGELVSIKGMVPSPYRRPTGCPFHTRCSDVIQGICDEQEPVFTNFGEGHVARCHLYNNPVQKTQAVAVPMRTEGGGRRV
ncbi:MAG: ABC transporter ATP-binding protein [Trueperaceae bacterium]